MREVTKIYRYRLDVITSLRLYMYVRTYHTYKKKMPPQNFVILGGGISGLTAAWYLARNAPSSTKITLLEASNRFGGWIQSTRVGEERILFEQGPRTLRPSGLGAYIILDMVKN